MRALFIGDIVGESGRRVVIENIQKLRDNYNLDFVIANGENSASGFGITEKILHSLIDSGVDVVTTGNHIWDQKETLVYIEITVFLGQLIFQTEHLVKASLFLMQKMEKKFLSLI